MIDAMIDAVIKREGGYVIHPCDRGGAAKYGITLADLQDWRGHKIGGKDVQALEPSEAAEIYRSMYIDKPKIGLLKDEALQALVFDTAVHSGTKRAIKLLQQAVGAQPDGILGSVTLGIIQGYKNSQEVRKRFLAARISYIGSVITGSPSQSIFAKGWAVRMSELLVEYV